MVWPRLRVHLDYGPGVGPLRLAVEPEKPVELARAAGLACLTLRAGVDEARAGSADEPRMQLLLQRA